MNHNERDIGNFGNTIVSHLLHELNTQKNKRNRQELNARRITSGFSDIENEHYGKELTFDQGVWGYWRREGSQFVWVGASESEISGWKRKWKRITEEIPSISGAEVHTTVEDAIRNLKKLWDETEAS